MRTKQNQLFLAFYDRTGSVLNLVLIGVLCLFVLAGGTWAYLSSSAASVLEEPLTTRAVQGLFIKEVLDQGEIQSSDNFEIRCQVKSRYGSRGVTVKELVEEGVNVAGGDFLIRLRSDELEENFENQTIEVNNAKDTVTAAQNNLESEEVARLEYVEGKYKELLGEILNKISQAETDRDKAKDYLDFSKKLQAKGFITRTELANDEAELQRRERDLQSSQRSKMVLETYTYKKTVKEFDSKITIAKSKLDAAKNNLAIEEKQLAEIKEQLDACTIVCPEGKSGQVVYANIFSRRGSSEFILEEGASVREGQVLIRLPNPDKMQVRATVNESRVTSIKENMDVKISVDALNGKELTGLVKKVNQYAEPEGWGGGGVRKYAVYVDVINPIREIRPGMNASVLVETERIENALMVPIQCVYGYRGKTFCLIKSGAQWETVEVQVGANNDTNVVINGGIESGVEVALNPAGFKEFLELPDLPEQVDSEESKKQKRQSDKSRPGGKKGFSGKTKKAEKARPKTKKPNNPGSIPSGGKTNQEKTDSRKSGPSIETAQNQSKKSVTDGSVP